MTYRNDARDRRPDHAGDRVQAGVVVLDLTGQALDADESRNASTKTIVECPSENQKPTRDGRWPSAISLRVVLSMAAMWSASNACRMPRV